MQTIPFDRLSFEQMTHYSSVVTIALTGERKHIFAALNNKAAEVLATAFTVKSDLSEFFFLSTFWFHVWYHTVVHTQHVSKTQFVLTPYFYHHWTSVGQHCCQKQQSHLSFAILFLLLLSLVHMKGKQNQIYALNLVLNHINSSLSSSLQSHRSTCIGSQGKMAQRAGEIPLEVLQVYSYHDIYNIRSLKIHYSPSQYPAPEIFTTVCWSPD